MHNSANTLTEQSARGRSPSATAISPLPRILMSTAWLSESLAAITYIKQNRKTKRQTNNQIQLYGVG
jgi:hypothetical protein